MNARHQKFSPAEWVIEKFQGVRATARALGRSAPSVSKWCKSVEEKGSGGRVPSKLQLVILIKAKEMKLDITPEDLILGRNKNG